MLNRLVQARMLIGGFLEKTLNRNLRMGQVSDREFREKGVSGIHLKNFMSFHDQY